ncbi:MAG: hypothetical protein LBE36_11850 [Flavobacteriaceae bacterium]|jgi:hypothetical protein|nr:hypothetical protein [Flavobacteriaceae bacterium]
MESTKPSVFPQISQISQISQIEISQVFRFVSVAKICFGYRFCVRDGSGNPFFGWDFCEGQKKDCNGQPDPSGGNALARDTPKK